MIDKKKLMNSLQMAAESNFGYVAVAKEVPGLYEYEITVYSHEDARTAAYMYEEEYNGELVSYDNPRVRIVGVCRFSDFDEWNGVMSAFYSQYPKHLIGRV